MIYCENLTNRDLITTALPMVNLSREQWKIFLSLCRQEENTNGKQSELYKVLEILCKNQARLEVMNMLAVNCNEDLDCIIKDESTEQIIIGL